MKYVEVKKELKKEFETFLKPLGYKSKSESQGSYFTFIKNEDQYTVGFGVVNYGDEFTTGCYVGVGIIPLQKVLYKLEGHDNLNETFGSTLGASISDYFNELNFTYKIKTLEDIKLWGEIVKKFYCEFAIPFFEKYNSIDAIDKLLNEKPTEKVIYCDDLGWRIIKGLIAAKLNSNPKYDQLRTYYKSEVQSKFQGHFMYDKCMKAIDFLDHHSIEKLQEIALTT